VDSVAIAKAAATLLLTVRGTPFLYYGQELGMVDNLDIPPDQLRDQAVMVATELGESPPPRDGARTPMQWDTSPHAGFSFGQDITPWLPVHANFETVNVATELADPDSILNFYRQLLRVRRKSDALRRGAWRSLIHYPHEHLAYVRESDTETVLVLINFSYEKPLTLDASLPAEQWTVLLSTHHPTADTMAIPDTLQSFEISLFRNAPPA
jgi:alpha-glucosidase